MRGRIAARKRAERLPMLGDLTGARARGMDMLRLAAATLVIVADLGARTVLSPAELPLGAVTALIGVPFFLARLRRLA